MSQVQELMDVFFEVRQDLLEKPREVKDSSLYYGRITRAGPFKYDDGIKIKKWDNIQEEIKKLDYLPVFGSRYIGAHDENRRSTELVGFLTNFELKNETEDAFSDLYFFKDISELSDLKNPRNLSISLKYGDMGQGQFQKIRGIHHAAISLNNLEDDRCGLDNLGAPCAMSPKNDLNTNQSGSDGYDHSTLTTTTQYGSSGDNVVNYSKLKESNTETTDMSENSDSNTSHVDSGKPTPDENEISQKIEACKNSGKSQAECIMASRREERQTKPPLEVPSMPKDMAEDAPDLTYEDLAGILDENDELRAQVSRYEEDFSKFKKELSDLKAYQTKLQKQEQARRDTELNDLRADLITRGFCEDFVNNRELETLKDFDLGIKGLDLDKFSEYIKSSKDSAKEEEIHISLSDMGGKIDALDNEIDAWMDMRGS